MLMWIIIIAVLIIGLALIILELVFIPGTTVVGLLGLVFTIVGIVITYNHFGSDVGLWVLLITLTITAISLFYSFKSGSWSKFSLKSSINSKVNEGSTSLLQVGDEGITLSALRPMGKAEFNEKIFEVSSQGNFIEPKQKIKIIQISSQQIIVEPV
jgi:membrane-bound ClpP family serine protease